MTNVDHLDNIIMQITTNPHIEGEPTLCIRGLDTPEQVDTYCIDEVEEIIDRLSLLLSEMENKRRMIELSKSPTLWDAARD
jgi:hypothetical protein